MTLDDLVRQGHLKIYIRKFTIWKTDVGAVSYKASIENLKKKPDIMTLTSDHVLYLVCHGHLTISMNYFSQIAVKLEQRFCFCFSDFLNLLTQIHIKVT